MLICFVFELFFIPKFILLQEEFQKKFVNERPEIGKIKKIYCDLKLEFFFVIEKNRF